VNYPHAEAANTYARQVIAGEIPACKWVRLACRRHMVDLERDGWDYEFRPEYAERVCNFIELLPHTKGKWALRRPGEFNLIRLEPWQAFVVCSLFGWVGREKSADGRHLRRFRDAYIAVPRKNGKSLLISAIGLYMLAYDREPGAEVFCGATSKDQAWEVFRPARLMAEKTEGLRRAFGVEVAAESLFTPATGGFFKPLIGKPGDGASPSCAIIDEYHEHKESTQRDTMRTGMGAREQPLCAVITTAGEDTASPCASLQRDMEQLLDGAFQDEETFAIIYTIDADDDWTSEDALWKANPNLGVSVFLDQLRSAQSEAVRSPRLANVFKTKRLNVWVHARNPWMNMEAWRGCDDAPPLSDFEGEECCIGLDLAAKVDITSKVRLFSREIDEHTHYYAYAQHYLPEERANEPGKGHYHEWVNTGHLIATDGNVIDYDRIESDLLEDAGRFRVLQIAFDKWGGTQLANNMQAHGLTMVEVPQTVAGLSEAMKWVEAMVLAGRFHHDGDPVLTWMFANVTAKTDANDNVFPRKERPENKIDGAVACIMAMSRMMVRQNAEPALYFL
jgi:phage terminase large subunit-like protein